jgi:periplasmic protein TonB
MASRYHDNSYKQRRTVAFAAIVAVHLFIAWAFISGFGQKAIKQGVQILETTIIKQDQPKDLPPPPPKPEMDRPPPPSVPIPIINVNIPVEAPPIIVTKAAPPPRPAPIVAATPAKTISLPDCHDEYYPSQELRQGHEGSAVVRICIGINNKIDGAVQLITSSGYPALDEAAGKCMSAGRYRAGTVEGKPSRTCKDYRVTFKAKEAQ